MKHKGKGVIRLGDKTTHGGRVLSAASGTMVLGKPAERAVAVNDLSDALESVLGSKGGDALLGGIELPLTRVLAAMAERGESFAEFSLRQSKAHAEFFRAQPLSTEEQAAFEETARQSLVQQTELEQNEVGDFDVFVGSYQASILAISN